MMLSFKKTHTVYTYKKECQFRKLWWVLSYFKWSFCASSKLRFRHNQGDISQIYCQVSPKIHWYLVTRELMVVYILVNTGQGEVCFLNGIKWNPNPKITHSMFIKCTASHETAIFVFAWIGTLSERVRENIRNSPRFGVSPHLQDPFLSTYTSSLGS